MTLDRPASARPVSPRPATLGVHGDEKVRTAGSPVVPPITQSATFFWASPADGELLYSRYGNNPNQRAVAEKMAALEGTEAAVALGSGMAATAMTLLALTEQGDHVVASSRLYGGTHALLTRELPRRGVTTTFVDPDGADGPSRDGASGDGPGGDGEGSAWERAITDRTRVIVIEIPSNPTMRVLDPRPIVAIARERGIRVLCDATFASPVNFRAAGVGIDLVMQSATKYLGGHSDLIAGIVSGPREVIDEVTRMAQLYGPALDPHAAWLLERGIRTLDARVRRHNENAMAVASWLEGRDEVARVLYPGLASHPDHALAADLMDGFGGMVGVVLAGGGDAADRFLSALRVAMAAPSLGGVETLVSQPRYTSHVGLSVEEREAIGIPDGFVRISVGLEDPDDLIADFERALG